jgi:2,5-diamino-6-(ribosylamino)-4(3H)-pyrimidinone 5'-phosphate reductase
MLPKVIIYNAVSLDGRLTGFKADNELYSNMASYWNVDAVFMGINMLITRFGALNDDLSKDRDFIVPDVLENDKLPLLVVPDNGGKIRIWSEIFEIPFIRDILVLCSRSTPQEYLNFLEKLNIKYMIIGYDKVNLGAALEELNTQFGVKSLRVDSGGILNGALIKDDLVDEICVLIHPVIVGGMLSNSVYIDPDLTFDNENLDLKLLKMEKLKNEIIFLHYRVMRYQF